MPYYKNTWGRSLPLEMRGAVIHWPFEHLLEICLLVFQVFFVIPSIKMSSFAHILAYFRISLYEFSYKHTQASDEVLA